MKSMVCYSLAAAFGFAVTACQSDPRYIDPGAFIEVGIPDSGIDFATLQVFLPARLETQEENMERAALSAELGGIEVPYVLRDELDISIEWSVRNLDDNDGTARVHVNGGNEWFYYVPANFVIDPEEDEEPPPLLGDIPIPIPALGTVSGVFREDQLREAAVDMELIGRGGGNPFAAILQNHSDITEFVDSAGATIPEQAFAHLVQFDVSLEANRHMVLEFAIRVRDRRDIVHELLLDAPPAELTAFAPVEVVPPPPPPP